MKATDEGDRFAGKGIGQVLSLLGRVVVAEDRGAPAGEVGVGAAEEAVGLVEAALAGVVLRVTAEVPFADPAGDVAGRLEAVGHRGFGEGKAGLGVIVAGIELVAESRLVAAGQESGPRGAAIRAGDVAVSAAEAAGGQRVEAGRRHVLAALKPCVGMTHVVGQKDDDVRPTLRFAAGRTVRGQ